MKKHEALTSLKSWSRFLIFLLIFTAALGGTSCKSKKKIAAEKAAIELANKIAQAKASLLDLLRPDNPKTYVEKVAELKRIKDMQLRDPEVEQLIDQVETMLAAEYQAMLRKQEEERLRLKAESVHNERQAELDAINMQFISVARAQNLAEANLRIQQALSFYASPEVPVLTIINVYGNNQKDYDKPTTILNYLNYLKDVKTYNRQVESFKLDVNRKIIEVELIKK